MRFGVLAATAVLIAGCASANYIEPGKYTSWADYWVKNDPSVARDVASIGGGPDDLQCVAGYKKTEIWGAGSWVDEMATGQRVMTADDKYYIEGMLKQQKSAAGTPEAFYGDALTWCQQNAQAD